VRNEAITNVLRVLDIAGQIAAQYPFLVEESPE
jgi:hypothetical protein